MLSQSIYPKRDAKTWLHICHEPNIQSDATKSAIVASQDPSTDAPQAREVLYQDALTALAKAHQDNRLYVFSL